jgi:tetratricopeptide (TPR) repeat protein
MAPHLPNIPAREALLADIRQLHHLASEGQREEALVIAKRIEATAVGLEVKSSALLLTLAILHDQLGHLEQALAYVIEAVKEDALDTNTDHSLGVIVNRVRKALATEGWKEESPCLYSTLAENGLADAACHVAWANWLHAKGRNEEALEVARSVTLLNPRCADAWQMVEVTALALGREAVAEDAAQRYVVAGQEDPAVGWNNAKWGQA